MDGVLLGGRVLKNNVIGRVFPTWSMQRSTPGSKLPGLQRQKDDLSPAFLHCTVSAACRAVHKVEQRTQRTSARQSCQVARAEQHNARSWLAVKPRWATHAAYALWKRRSALQCIAMHWFALCRVCCSF